MAERSMLRRNAFSLSVQGAIVLWGLKRTLDGDPLGWALLCIGAVALGMLVVIERHHQRRLRMLEADLRRIREQAREHAEWKRAVEERDHDRG